MSMARQGSSNNGSGGNPSRQIIITDELRFHTLTKLIEDLCVEFSTSDHILVDHLSRYAFMFENQLYNTPGGLTKEQYVAILSSRPAWLLLQSNGHYILSPPAVIPFPFPFPFPLPFPFPVPGAMQSPYFTYGAGSSQQQPSWGIVSVFQDPSSMPSGAILPSSTGIATPAQQAFLPKNHHNDYLNTTTPNTYHQQQQLINLPNDNLRHRHGSNSANEHTRPRRDFQPRRRQQNQSNSSATPANQYSGSDQQTSQQPQTPASVDTQQKMTNNDQMAGSSKQLTRSGKHKATVQGQETLVQKSKNKGIIIQEPQQLPTEPAAAGVSVTGTVNFPAIIPEDSTEWHGIAYSVLQRCKTECSSVIDFSSQIPEGNSEDMRKMASAAAKMAKFMNMPKSSLMELTKRSFYTEIGRIYSFDKDIRATHSSVLQQQGGSTAHCQLHTDAVSLRVTQLSTDASVTVAKCINQNQEMVVQDVDEIGVHDLYGIDILIESGYHTLESSS